MIEKTLPAVAIAVLLALALAPAVGAVRALGSRVLFRLGDYRGAMLESAAAADLGVVAAALLQAEQALQQEDGEGLHDFLERAALARRFWGGRSGLS